jgi:mRNA-degrading endonuclease RelE of RelBE toxin-antitoxin system
MNGRRMKRLVIQTLLFSEDLDTLIKDRKLLEEDYEDFELNLVAFPDQGDVIQGTNGLRKIRLKSSSKGKSGGFRVCYCDVPEKEKLFLMVIFPKSVKENLSQEEKNYLKHLVSRLKGE